MRWRGQLKLLLFAFLLLWLMVALWIFSLTNAVNRTNAAPPSNEILPGVTRLAVLVPFRDRFYELSQFVPYMTNFLRRQKIKHHIFVVHQVDGYRFNRAALINAGFLETPSFDYIAIHDVDLLPDNENISYSYPSLGPRHLTPPDLHPNYHYATFLGGILLLTRGQFQLADGMSNIFWGWGREDDEFRLRLLDKGMHIYKPEGITTGRKTYRHLHDSNQHPRDMTLTFNQRDLTYHRDVVTGVNTLRYRLRRKYRLRIDEAEATVLDVALHCDLEWTPYCQFSRSKT